MCACQSEGARTAYFITERFRGVKRQRQNVRVFARLFAGSLACSLASPVPRVQSRHARMLAGLIWSDAFAKRMLYSAVPYSAVSYHTLLCSVISYLCRAVPCCAVPNCAVQ